MADPRGAAAQDSVAMKQAIRDALESDGQLDGIKAQLRARIFHALDGSSAESVERPTPTPETMIVHELIRDYLAYAGLNHTLAVMQAEASLPRNALPRSVLTTEMGLPGASHEVPVMYSLVAERFAAKNSM